jgi:UDP-2,3-diacylglucosamine hydrolase
MMKTSPDRRALIVADAHLPLDDRSGGEAQRQAFLELVDHHAGRLGLVVLLGDLFDFWYEWRHVVPKRAFRILARMRELVLDGVEVHYFAGNHDFRLAGFLRDDVGLTLHMDSWTPELDGRRYWMHHGDGLAASDVNYRRMKRVFRSRLAQGLFGGILHPDLAMGLGRGTSEKGRRRHAKRGGTIWPPESEYIEAARGILRQGHDVAVFGHTHGPLDRELEEGHVHNPGAFFRDGHYSVIEGGLPQREVWR